MNALALFFKVPTGILQGCRETIRVLGSAHHRRLSVAAAIIAMVQGALQAEAYDVVYTHYDGGSTTVWRATCDGASVTNRPLTASGKDDFAVPSPDGRSIAFLRRRPSGSFRNLWVMNIDGTAQREIYAQPSGGFGINALAWSPDSTRIVVNYEGHLSIIRVEDGQSLHTAALPSTVSADGLHWRPDGAEILLSASYGGWYSVARVSNELTDYALLEGGTPHASNPTYSQDGGLIVYDDSWWDHGSIRTMTVTGTNQTTIFDDPPPSGVERKHCFAWTPDSGRIVYNYYPYAKTSAGDLSANLGIMNPDGGNRVAYVMPGHNLLYAVSPKLMDMAGIGATSDAMGRNQCISSDGRKLVFMSDRDGQWEIYMMNLDGSGATNVSNMAGIDSNPQFLPDRAIEVRIFTAVELEWSSSPGAVYQVQWSSDLMSRDWWNLDSAITSTGSVCRTFDSTRYATNRFYRVTRQE